METTEPMGTSSNTTTFHSYNNTHVNVTGRIAFSVFLALFTLIFLCICCRVVRISRRRRGGALSCSTLGSSAISAEALRSIPVFVHTASDRKADCSVCLEDLKQGDVCKRLPTCGHAFHAGCIDTWLKSHSTCPLCRTLINPELPAASEAIV